jgi:hypothetical protein
VEPAPGLTLAVGVTMTGHLVPFASEVALQPFLEPDESGAADSLQHSTLDKGLARRVIETRCRSPCPALPTGD